MDFFLPSLVQGVVQGITESLPVSSSAHVLVVQRFLNLQPDHTLVLSLHVGTVLSVLCYFWREVWGLFQEAFDFLKERKPPTLILSLVLATLPVAVAGVLIKPHVEFLENSLRLIGILSIVFGILLAIADKKGELHPFPSESPTLIQSIVIGLTQILALLPGASRLGVTMTMGRLLGISRKGILPFSFLLSLPATGGGLILMAPKAIATLSFPAFLAGSLSAFFIGLLALRLFVPWMSQNSLLPLALYRMAFGAFILLWVNI